MLSHRGISRLCVVSGLAPPLTHSLLCVLLTLEQRGPQGASPPCSRQSAYNLWSAPCVTVPLYLRFRCWGFSQPGIVWYCSVYLLLKKYVHISGPGQFKRVLLKGQL